MIRVAINGFGRIGRTVTRVIQSHSNIELVAINDLTDAKTLAHLLKYDSVHGRFNGTIDSKANEIIINGKSVKIINEKDPVNLPWKDLNIDIVIESTGRFLTKDLAQAHISAGAKKVILSAPPKSDDVSTVVLGINDDIITGKEEIISNASCTTNAAAPLIKVLHDFYHIESAYITTVHSYTGDQSLHDSPHKDLRRARAGALSIIPTTTGAAKAITKIFPDLDNKIGGCGVRVPVPNGSLIDISLNLKEDTTVEAINQKFKEASETYLKSVLEYTDDPIVSVDIIGNTHSCIFDSQLTSITGHMVKIMGWYDNEAGYSNRLVDLIMKIA
ncbi:type I glyceraldehyde-3-phosphate dehydrogenase [Vicingus serpentipes]|uniref:Type I glyceraldehyde-3-phosphate dehydrogenase n=1 Tax=Vicingus serpentipes TaxID=1926625 RepID=A0A5C6RZ03_9FLAO|nr:type I glyceraldehyde-3-phosphate dehydrogenase [Vicingus serpentipes]TXB67195.1 type I glyceraldehyde-3-phosphate dehydrogenase [Vicingus serpentipes]